jgi:hypothetical protein
MMKLIVALLAAAVIGVGAWWVFFKVDPPDVAFAEATENGLPVDFARIESTMPLTAEDLQRITPRNIQALSQEQVDQIYARLDAGPIPDGPFDGDLFFPRGVDSSRFAEVVGGGVDGGLKGMAANLNVAKLEFLGARLWRGKVFDSETRILRNRITNLNSLDLLLDATEEQQLEELYDDDLGQALLFPAKLYCGQSLLDGRRESIIIDYAYTDDLPGYLEKLDHLVGREGLRIRDEIRMVRPGFYLGRAYMDRVFVLNFTLYNETIAEGAAGDSAGADGQERCWAGEQDRTLSAAL